MKSISKRCRKLNQEISKNNLAIFTWGNVSIRDQNTMFIKPSGVPFDDLDDSQISKIDIESGQLLGGKKQSVDTPIHLEIYKAFKNINAVMHTHSHYATVFAQAKLPIPILGTTHADYFPNQIPVADQIDLTSDEQMEVSVGKSLVSTLKKFSDNKAVLPILIPCHGVVLAMSDESKIIEYAIVLEEVAKLAFHTLLLKKDILIMPEDTKVLKFHFDRKHGKRKYYGQTIR